MMFIVWDRLTLPLESSTVWSMTNETPANATERNTCNSHACNALAIASSGWCKYHLLFPTDRVDTNGRRAGVVGENLNTANSDDLATED